MWTRALKALGRPVFRMRLHQISHTECLSHHDDPTQVYLVAINPTGNLHNTNDTEQLKQCKHAKPVGTVHMLVSEVCYWPVAWPLTGVTYVREHLKCVVFTCTPQQGWVAVTTQALPPSVSAGDCSIPVWGMSTLCHSAFCCSHCLLSICTGPMGTKQS